MVTLVSHANNFVAGNSKFYPQVYSLFYHNMSWLKPKSVENYTGTESEEPFGDEMPNFHICGRISVGNVSVFILKVHDGVAERIDNACTKKKNTTEEFSNIQVKTFVSRAAHILKVPRVNLELWDGLCRLASLPKGINQRYYLSSQSCQQTRGSQEK